MKSLRAIRKYLRIRSITFDTEPLFATDEGLRFTTRALFGLLQRRIKAAGVKQYGLHDFRRRGLYELWNRTRDIKGVSVYAGHSTVTVTQVYLGITDQDVLSIHEKASPVDNWNF